MPEKSLLLASCGISPLVLIYAKAQKAYTVLTTGIPYDVDLPRGLPLFAILAIVSVNAVARRSARMIWSQNLILTVLVTEVSNILLPK